MDQSFRPRWMQDFGNDQRILLGAGNRFAYNTAVVSAMAPIGRRLMRRATRRLGFGMKFGGAKRSKLGHRKTAAEAITREIGANIVTQQDDAKLTWRNRRMPRRKMRRMKKSVRLWRRNEFTQLPQLTYHRHYDTFPGITNVVGGQTSYSVSIGSYGGSLGSDDDLSVVMNNAVSGITQGQSMQVCSMRLTYTLTNVPGQTGTPIALIDVYECVFRRDCPIAVATNPNSLFNLFQAGTIGAGPISGTILGITPFQNSSFCKYVKILNKKRINLQAGQSVTDEHFYPGFTFYADQVTDLFAMKGKSKFHLFIQCATPGTLSVSPAVTVALTATKTYNVKIMGHNNAGAGFV